MSESIADRQRHLEDSLQKLEDLMFDVGQLTAELWQAIEDLAPKLGEKIFSEVPPYKSPIPAIQ